VRARPETIERFGPFEVYRQLAPGSGQRLDLAHDTRTDSDVTLLRVQASDVGFFARRRFRRAHEQARAIEHDNLLAPLEVGQEQNELYVRYPAIDGISAEQLLRDAGRDLRVDGAVLVVRELCRGLDHLAATVGAGFRPVVSDRLVLVGREGRVVLTVVADPAGGAQADRYLAPEEDAGGRGDARSAVFSAGILLYELLAREAIEPGRKLTLPSVDTVRIQVPPGLAATTMRAVEVRPEDRFPSAGELERALDEELSALAPRFAERDLAEWLAGRFPA
jgi:serine/threonine-protein kinase